MIEKDFVILALRKALESFSLADKVYLVGGVLRDYALSAKTHDYDIVVEFPQGNILLAEHLYNAGTSSPPKKFKNHDIISCSINDAQLQISTTQVNHSRTNISDKFGDLYEDAFSRDFTINSLYLRIHDLTLLDPTQMAVKDLSGKILRSAYDAKSCILDDPLRILRAIRFSLNFDFKIEHIFAKQMQEKSKLLKQIHIKRISAEIIEILRISPYQGLTQLMNYDIIHHLSPALNIALGKAISNISSHGLTSNLSTDEEEILLPLYILWIYLFSHTRTPHSYASTTKEKTDILLKEISQLMIIRHKTQARLKNILNSICYLSANQNQSICDIGLRLLIWGLGKDLQYLCHYINWRKCQSQDGAHYDELLQRLHHNANTLAKIPYPLDGNILATHINISERPKTACYMFLLRLKWLIDPNQDLCTLLNHASLLKIYESNEAICQQTFTYQKNLDWLWHWADWHHKGWI